jgi:hypothetical protein
MTDITWLYQIKYYKKQFRLCHWAWIHQENIPLVPLYQAPYQYHLHQAYKKVKNHILNMWCRIPFTVLHSIFSGTMVCFTAVNIYRGPDFSHFV